MFSLGGASGSGSGGGGGGGSGHYGAGDGASKTQTIGAGAGAGAAVPNLSFGVDVMAGGRGVSAPSKGAAVGEGRGFNQSSRV